MCLSSQFLLPAGQGLVSIQARVIGSTTVSNSVSLWYAAPVVTAVTPRTGPTQGGAAVVLSGVNLGIGAFDVPPELGCVAVNRVTIGGQECDVTQVRCAQSPAVPPPLV